MHFTYWKQICDLSLFLRASLTFEVHSFHRILKDMRPVKICCSENIKDKRMTCKSLFNFLISSYFEPQVQVC